MSTKGAKKSKAEAKSVKKHRDVDLEVSAAVAAGENADQALASFQAYGDDDGAADQPMDQPSAGAGAGAESKEKDKSKNKDKTGLLAKKRQRKVDMAKRYVTALNSRANEIQNLCLLVDAISDAHPPYWSALTVDGIEPDVAVVVDALKARKVTERRNRQRLEARALKRSRDADPSRPQQPKLGPHYYMLRKMMRKAQPEVTDDQVRDKFKSFASFADLKAFLATQ
jgi:hypothetical protein